MICITIFQSVPSYFGKKSARDDSLRFQVTSSGLRRMPSYWFFLFIFCFLSVLCVSSSHFLYSLPLKRSLPASAYIQIYFCLSVSVLFSSPHSLLAISATSDPTMLFAFLNRYKTVRNPMSGQIFRFIHSWNVKLPSWHERIWK